MPAESAKRNLFVSVDRGPRREAEWPGRRENPPDRPVHHFVKGFDQTLLHASRGSRMKHKEHSLRAVLSCFCWLLVAGWGGAFSRGREPGRAGPVGPKVRLWVVRRGPGRTEGAHCFARGELGPLARTGATRPGSVQVLKVIR